MIDGLWKPVARITADSQYLDELKRTYANDPDIRVNKRSISFRRRVHFGPRAGNYSECATALVPVGHIHTDERRFQNRTDKYSRESVERIVRNFDPNRLDPVVVWQDPANNRIYMLSGHSRLQAHRQLAKETIPAKFFQGTEAEAIKFAKVDANRAATAETLAEDVRAYRMLRDGDTALNLAPLPRKELQERFKGNWQKLDNYTYLNPGGTLMQLLGNKETHDQFKYLLNRASTIGYIRKTYPQLTNAHEQELFHFWYNDPKGHELKPDDYVALVSKRVGRFDFRPEEPLSLDKLPTTGTEARADTRATQQRIYELKEQEKRLREKYNQARTKAEKEALAAEISASLEERGRLERDLAIVLKTQTALFGLDGIDRQNELLRGAAIGLGVGYVAGMVVPGRLLPAALGLAAAWWAGEKEKEAANIGGIGAAPVVAMYPPEWDSLPMGALKRAALHFYMQNVSGKSIRHPKGFTVYFPTRAGRKALYQFANTDYRVMKMIPSLPEIVAQATLLNVKPPKPGREEIAVINLQAKAVVEGKIVPVKIVVKVVKKDKANHYYTHLLTFRK